MWQTLETKAKFIHQVMTGRNDMRHIENIDGAALTYAKVEAIASGNPLVIEKAHIDAELVRLSRLRAQHHETQYRIRNTIRRTTEEIGILANRIANLQKDIAARRPTQGDAFKIRIERTDYTDRGVAGELINRRAQQLRSSGKEHTVQSLDQKLVQTEKDIGECRKRMAELEAKVGESFEYEAKLKSLAQRQEEIVKALDLTRNQASNRLDANSAGDGEQRIGQAPANGVAWDARRRP